MGITKRKKFIIGFWIVFVLLFIISHKFLAGIIINYQQRPANETKEAYQLITQYQQALQDFYEQHKRCPQMADKSIFIPQGVVYHYVKTLRFLDDPVTGACFITAVMRDDTPSKAVKGRLVTVAYNVKKQSITWQCYTNIESDYTVDSCRNKPLPPHFLHLIQQYEKSINSH